MRLGEPRGGDHRVQCPEPGAHHGAALALFPAEHAVAPGIAIAARRAGAGRVAPFRKIIVPHNPGGGGGWSTRVGHCFRNIIVRRKNVGGSPLTSGARGAFARHARTGRRQDGGVDCRICGAGACHAAELGAGRGGSRGEISARRDEANPIPERRARGPAKARRGGGGGMDKVGKTNFGAGGGANLSCLREQIYCVRRIQKNFPLPLFEGERAG